MPGDASVIADPANGAAIVAGTRVTMSAALNGALRFGGPGGWVLRPLTFWERTELVSAACALPAARDAVAAAVLAGATVERGEGSTLLMEVLAMWLAGAAFDAPDFTQTTLLVARAAGWPPQKLFETAARDVDRLAVHLDGERRAAEWNSLVFAEAPAETVEEVRARFAGQLLRRSAAPVTKEQAIADERWETHPSQQPRATASGKEAPLDDRSDVRRAGKLPLSKSAALLPHPGAAAASGIAFLPVSSPHTTKEETTSVAVAALRHSEARPSPSAERSGLRFGVAAQMKGAAVPPHLTAHSRTAERAAFTSSRLPGSATAAFEDFVPAAAAVSAAVAPLPHAEPHAMPAWSAAAVVRSSPPPVPAEEPRQSVRFESRSRAGAAHPEDLAATLAVLLDDEADLRGVER